MLDKNNMGFFQNLYYLPDEKYIPIDCLDTNGCVRLQITKAK
jgi:hypothetical protein